MCHFWKKQNKNKTKNPPKKPQNNRVTQKPIVYHISIFTRFQHILYFKWNDWLLNHYIRAGECTAAWHTLTYNISKRPLGETRCLYGRYLLVLNRKPEFTVIAFDFTLSGIELVIYGITRFEKKEGNVFKINVLSW